MRRLLLALTLVVAALVPSSAQADVLPAPALYRLQAAAQYVERSKPPETGAYADVPKRCPRVPGHWKCNLRVATLTQSGYRDCYFSVDVKRRSYQLHAIDFRTCWPSAYTGEPNPPDGGPEGTNQ